MKVIYRLSQAAAKGKDMFKVMILVNVKNLLNLQIGRRLKIKTNA